MLRTQTPTPVNHCTGCDELNLKIAALNTQVNSIVKAANAYPAPVAVTPGVVKNRQLKKI